MTSTEPTRLSLSGRTIVTTRAKSQADEFAAELARYGADVVYCPMIEIQPLESYDRLDEAINHLYGYDWLILTSANAVHYFFERLSALGHDSSSLDEIKVCAIGEATAEKLSELKVHVDVVPDEFKAEGALLALERYVGGRGFFSGLNILLPRATTARDFLPKSLEDAGARVDIVPVYRTTLPADSDRGRVAAMLSGTADCVAFTSSSTVKNLAQLFDTTDLSEVLAAIKIACLGDITAKTAHDFGLTVHIQPEKATIPNLANAIAQHFASATQ